jgi:hypothetical protein
MLEQGFEFNPQYWVGKSSFSGIFEKWNFITITELVGLN